MDEVFLGLAITDLERRILFMNSALETLSGFSRDEVWGIPCRDVLRTSLCSYHCPLPKVTESHSSVTAEGNLINRGRQKIPVRVRTAPLHDIKGRIVGFLETMEDIRAHQGGDDKAQSDDSFSQFIGRSPRIRDILRLVPVIAQTDSSLLITGETGTGKDVLAEIVHNASERSEGAFVKINCGALPETLLESELFGHKKGAFTGAVNDKMGRLRLAHNGTLFLTEIGDLPLPLQAKLLTFLDDKIVYPLGCTNGFQSDARVIAATNRDLERMVEEGLFRRDLLFRLNVVRLHLPPLREREEDINLLLDHFIKLFSTRFGKKVKDFSRQARHVVLNYAYPGNVRELRNIVEYATSICSSHMIGMEDLPTYLYHGTEMIGTKNGLKGRLSTPARPNSSLEKSTMSWASVERQLIIDALLKARGRRSRAAELIGWGRSTLWRKMKQYGIQS
ncbi:MAG: sigma 54-interacting transcriptional regulator [Deltaproteobacteria bacterium]|nr:sigma 54-interacting transcriptional regulator [Deltaproteobacteria bacterium]